MNPFVTTGLSSSLSHARNHPNIAPFANRADAASPDSLGFPMTKKLATIRGMATGIAVLITCLYTACGGGNGAQGADPLSFADIGADAESGVLVAAAGNAAVLQAAGGRKAASGVP